MTCRTLLVFTLRGERAWQENLAFFVAAARTLNTLRRTLYGSPSNHDGWAEGRMLDSSLHKIGYVLWWEDMKMWWEYGLEDDGYDFRIEALDIKPADPDIELPRTVASEGRVRQPWERDE